jgi:hypothetical protein
MLIQIISRVENVNQRGVVIISYKPVLLTNQ